MNNSYLDLPPFIHSGKNIFVEATNFWIASLPLFLLILIHNPFKKIYETVIIILYFSIIGIIKAAISQSNYKRYIMIFSAQSVIYLLLCGPSSLTAHGMPLIFSSIIYLILFYNEEYPLIPFFIISFMIYLAYHDSNLYETGYIGNILILLSVCLSIFFNRIKIIFFIIILILNSMVYIFFKQYITATFISELFLSMSVLIYPYFLSERYGIVVLSAIITVLGILFTGLNIIPLVRLVNALL